MGFENVKILVVGAGISGIRCALDLAELGYRVGLIDKAPAMGGILSRLDQQFPNDHCGMCRMLSMIDRDAGPQFCLRKGLFHENIETLLAAEVISVQGAPGNLAVTVAKQPTGVDAQRCTGCRACESECPVEVGDVFNAGLGRRRAIYLPVPHQIPNARVIDWDACTRCGACQNICPAAAIELKDERQTLVLENVGAVVLATGVDLFDPAQVDLYGIGKLPNVVTATAFERIMSSSGPYEGRLVRPSDGKAVEKIAWVQCVGSRNVMLGADYCSSVCCMFAIKEAVLACQKIGPNAEAVVFYMDMRTFGRDFQRYRDRAEHDFGVRFVRCRIHSIEPEDDPDMLSISYVDSAGRLVAEHFDMVVLSTGRHPQHKLPEFAKYNGVFTIDSAQHFMDISAAVIQAGDTSEKVRRSLHGSGLYPEHPLSDHSDAHRIFEKAPHLQVVLCSCGESLNKLIDWDKIERQIRMLPGNIDVVRMSTVCDLQGWEQMIQTLRQGTANRLLLASCNPLVYLSRFKDLEMRTGIMPSLMEAVNLHHLADPAGDPVRTTDTVRLELEMGIQRLLGRMPTESNVRSVSQRALIVGGGPAGLSAALSLAAHNVEVVLVDKSDRLGGNLAHFGADQAREKVEPLVSEAERHPLIRVCYQTEVVHHSGRPGQFVARIRHKSGDEEPLIYGTAILATGGSAAPIRSYAYGQHAKIVTIYDLEKRLTDPNFAADTLQTAVFVQCVESREEPRNYCSRICCAKTLKAAVKIRALHPQAQVYVFYRDIMTYGASEIFYAQARRNGVIFIPFETSGKPGVQSEGDQVLIEGWDPVLGESVRFQPDLLVLAGGVVPNPVQTLAAIFGIDTTQDGFMKEADSKWRPVDSGQEGVFIAGLGRAPAKAEEAMAEGRAAAQRALRILSKGSIRSAQQVARVRHAVCSRCQLCIRACPYHARYVDHEQGMIMVDHLACQGCGLCAAECPNSATILGCLEENGILNAIEAAL